MCSVYRISIAIDETTSCILSISQEDNNKQSLA